MTVQEIKNINIEFKNLDLSKYPQERAELIFKKIRKFPVFSTIFHPGMIVYRARPNDSGENFSERGDLSYKPQEFNKTYQRASTPNKTMFYGAVIPVDNLNYELDTEMVIAASEASYLLRDPSKYENGEQKIVFGKWRIIRDCKLGTILHSEPNKNITPYSQSANQRMMNWFKDQHSDYLDQVKLFLNYFSGEYSKNDIAEGEDFKYLISANLSEILIKMGLNGVIYPSVRVGGRGINVAIEPDFVDNYMRLEGVCECTIYKKGKKIIINNDRLAFTKPEDQSFKLENIEIGKFKAPDEVIRKMLEEEE